MSSQDFELGLRRPVDPARDHVRSNGAGRDTVTVLIYGDYLCPYCRRLREILERLRHAMGDRLMYAFRQFPNERAHPGATFASRAAEAAGLQDRFWPMHDALYTLEPPLTEDHVIEAARSIGLDMKRFDREVAEPKIVERVDSDLADGRANGVTGTPTIFVDGQRYDGAWDFYSMLETLERPVGERVRSTARAFANLPASAGIVLMIAAAAALLFANTPLAGLYHAVVDAQVGIGVIGRSLSLSVSDWCSEGLLTFFFLQVGLEIRREAVGGAFTDRRAALLPILGAIGGVVAPAAIYLALNPGSTASGWAAPTSTGIAFALGILAVMGRRAPVGLKLFVAALAVVDDILSMLTLAIFFPKDFQPLWLIPAVVLIGVMFVLNRWRVYAGWPYLAVTVGLWLTLHAAGVNAALAGVVLAAFLPTRPAPSAGPLLAQAATALADLEHAESEKLSAGDPVSIEQEPIWDWASRNLSAAAARLLSPAERVERAVAPWSTYLILPLFAFSATGFALSLDVSSPDSARVLAGVVLGLVIGKPAGVILAAVVAVKAKIAVLPDDTSRRAFLGGALLCGVSDPIALLLADHAFPHGGLGALAKIGVLVGSVIAAALGAVVLATGAAPVTKMRDSDPAAASRTG